MHLRRCNPRGFVLHFKLAFEGKNIMSAKTIGLLVSVAVLALAACAKNTETAVAAEDGEAVAEAPAAAPVIEVNEGEPIDGDVTLTVPATVMAGAEIDLSFTGPANRGDYIDIVPRGSTQTSGELNYIYIPAAAKGEKLRALTAPGDYDVRYVLELAGSRIIKAVQPLTVTAASASLTAPSAASGAEPLSIEWTGPGNPGDYIDVVPAGYATTSGEIAYAYTASGNPVKFSAPGAAGAYEIRYVIEGPGGRKVLTSSPLAVTLPVANLTAPETARKNAKLIVEYEGPMRSGDYIDLVKKGYVATSGELSYFYADGKSANELEMPAEAGAYEIRYVMEAPGGRIILDRQSIEVR